MRTLAFGRTRAYFRNGFYPPQIRHRHIEDDQVGSDFVQDTQKFQAIANFSRYFQVGVFLQNQPQAVADKHMVIGQNHAI